tara:strand:+ start:77 stop:1186 length:1110 start_codon:yes stop_codon:yes gene_type:complete
MINFLKRNTFPAIIALSALSVSGSAAFYSVYGLSKLFAGATFEVIIMAGSLEVAKLVIASLLYQYWNDINKFLRTYLTIATVILVIITSMGIYGFLSAAYQDTYQKLLIDNNKIEFLENKANFYQEDVKRYEKELEQILDNITALSETRSVSIQVKDTSVAGGVRNTISTVDLRLAQDRLRIEEDKRKDVNLKRNVAADSLQNIKLEILQLENNSETSGELGPLKYLAGLTNTPMDRIINILLLIIIFVFDPLAISLVVAANYAFDVSNRKNLYGERESNADWDDIIPEEDEEDLTELQKTLLMDVEEDEKIDTKKGYQLENNIKRILKRTPNIWTIELKTGQIVEVKKEEVEGISFNEYEEESSKRYF